MPRDPEAFKAAHAAATTGARSDAGKDAGPSSPPPPAFSDVEVTSILNRARERASGDLVTDEIAHRRILVALSRGVLLEQWAIVRQRLDDYSNGLCPYPKDEVQALKVIDELSRLHNACDTSKSDTPQGHRKGVDVSTVLRDWTPHA